MRFEQAFDGAADPAVLESLWVERADWMERHPCRRTIGTWESSCEAPKVYRGMGGDVERWRPLVAQYFSDVNTALAVMKCESGGNPNAFNKSGASGLMQVMPFWADSLGIPRKALFDPATNLRVAAYVLEVQGWKAWSAYRRGCR